MSKNDIENYFYDIPLDNLRIGDIGPVLDKLRGNASAELQVSGKIPMSIRVIFGIGPDGSAEDLWELRQIISTLNEELSDYFDKPKIIGKPKQVI